MIIMKMSSIINLIITFHIQDHSATTSCSSVSDRTSASPRRTMKMKPRDMKTTWRTPDTAFCLSFSRISKKTTYRRLPVAMPWRTISAVLSTCSWSGLVRAIPTPTPMGDTAQKTVM